MTKGQVTKYKSTFHLILILFEVVIVLVIDRNVEILEYGNIEVQFQHIHFIFLLTC